MKYLKFLSKTIMSAMMLALAVTTSCGVDADDEEETGNWIKQSDFEGVTRSGAISFVIGNYAYVGLGYDGDDYLQDFWRYDPARNFWEVMAEFPGTGRISAIAFSAAGKGYIGTGFNDELDEEELADFWEYDPATNQWEQKSDFGGGGRFGAVAFAIKDIGYVGTGYDGNYYKDFWSYNPATDAWTKTISLFGSKREQAIAFVINDIAYVCSGRNNGQSVFDFWSFDPSLDTWTELTPDDDEDDYYEDFEDAVSRYAGSAVTLGNMAYIGAGFGSTITTTFYSFNATTNAWDRVADLEGAARIEASGFTVQDRMYMVLGRSGTARFDDLWEFRPDLEFDEDD